MSGPGLCYNTEINTLTKLGFDDIYVRFVVFCQEILFSLIMDLLAAGSNTVMKVTDLMMLSCIMLLQLQILSS